MLGGKGMKPVCTESQEASQNENLPRSHPWNHLIQRNCDGQLHCHETGFAIPEESYFVGFICSGLYVQRSLVECEKTIQWIVEGLHQGLLSQSRKK